MVKPARVKNGHHSKTVLDNKRPTVVGKCNQWRGDGVGGAALILVFLPGCQLT